MMTHEDVKGNYFFSYYKRCNDVLKCINNFGSGVKSLTQASESLRGKYSFLSQRIYIYEHVKRLQLVSKYRYMLLYYKD